jgi:hypothetical protein
LAATIAGTSTSADEIIFAVEEASKGGYFARAFGHNIFTEAETMDALRAAVREPVRCHFDDRPKAIRLHLVRGGAAGAPATRKGAGSCAAALGCEGDPGADLGHVCAR